MCARRCRCAWSGFRKQLLADVFRLSMWFASDLTAFLPPAPMSFAAATLLSAKCGAVRGCRSGSRWLNSALLVSISPTLPTSPGSVAIFLLLPAPGARSKWSSMTSDLDLRTAWEEEPLSYDAQSPVFPSVSGKCVDLSQQNTAYFAVMLTSPRSGCVTVNTQLWATSFNNKLAAAHRPC